MRSMSYCCADIACDGEAEDVGGAETADDGGLSAGPFAVDGGGVVRWDSQIASGESGKYLRAEASVVVSTFSRMVFWK
jgi:hypothetical protein